MFQAKTATNQTMLSGFYHNSYHYKLLCSNTRKNKEKFHIYFKGEVVWLNLVSSIQQYKPDSLTSGYVRENCGFLSSFRNPRFFKYRSHDVL